MTDKYTCQQKLHAAGAVVPEQLGLVESAESFFDTQFTAAQPRVFLKSRFGSSGAGVVALQRNRDGRMSATSAVRLAEDGRLYNHLRVTRLTAPTTIRALVDRLAAQGAYAERWTSKPRVPFQRDVHHDVRVVAFRGLAHQRIARLSTTPLTNLHLGNRRAAPDWHGEEERAALDTASAVAARAFPRSASIGLDVIVRGAKVTVLEANAFGDLLPDLHHAGRTTYDDQAEIALADDL